MTKIMIVDDDQTTTSLLQTLLELDGYEVIVVRRGLDVVSKTEQNTPDLIMIDYHLTDTDGSEVIKEIRAHADEAINRIPIIMASGMDKSDEAMSAGANKFIVKPFEPSELPDLFNSLISGK